MKKNLNYQFIRKTYKLFSLQLFQRAALCLFLLFSSFSPLQARAAITDWDTTPQAKIRLAAGFDPSGNLLQGVLQYDLSSGWHIYWRTPGDAGQPPVIDWKESTNVKQIRMLWPLPQRNQQIENMQNFSYSNKVDFPLEILPENPDKPVHLALSVSYAICREICIPARSTLSLAIPARHIDPSVNALFQQAHALTPSMNGGGGLTLQKAELIHTQAGPITLAIRATAQTPFTAPELFIEGPSGYRFPAPEKTFEDNKKSIIFTQRVEIAPDAPRENISLVMTLTHDGLQAVEKTVLLSFPETPAVPSSPTASVMEKSLTVALLSALLGGLILNVMPCVLPVLSIKLLSFAKQAGREKKAIRKSFLLSALGIVTSFLLFALLVIALKTAGYAVGFGFQFQQPVFLIALTTILLLFACNLWGKFEINLPSWLGGKMVDKLKQQEHTPLGSFLEGAFATLLATPCSAPFVGTALSFALSRGSADILLIFFCMGAGMATPYLFFSSFPKVVSFMPKPGKWMLHLKSFLAILLVITAIWLIWVISRQLGFAAALLVFLCNLMLKFLIENDTGLLRYNAVKASAFILTLLLTFILPIQTYQKDTLHNQRVENIWRPFDQPAISMLVQAGNVVVVDVTADWCITCKVNKSLVLDRTDVLTLLSSPAIIAMRADLTSPNTAITRYLESFNRYGIPFNVVYGPGAPEGITLSELLTRGELLDAIKKAKERRK